MQMQGKVFPSLALSLVTIATMALPFEQYGLTGDDRAATGHAGMQASPTESGK